MKRTIGDNSVSRFAVQITVANYGDMTKAKDGLLPKEKVRRQVVAGIVDSGAKRLVLPQALAKQLGLRPAGKAKVRYADHRTATRNRVNGVYLELLGRNGTFAAIVEPKRTTALIGAIVLEDLDLLIDCLNEKLVPRDPRFVIDEVE